MHFEIPFGVARSAAIPLIFASRISFRTFSIVSSTRAWVRPVMTTDAPSRASARAIANPIPAVDPVTRVFFPSNCKFIGRSFLYSFRAYRETKNSQARLWPARLHKNRWRSDRVHDFKRPDRRLDDSLLRFGAYGALFRWPLSVPLR